MAYELTQKVTLTNLLSDPSFENEGWVAKSNCTVSKDTTYSLNGSYSLKIVTGTGSESYIGTTTNPPMVQGHTYYVCIHKYQTTTAINHLQFYWPEAEPSMYSREGLVSIPNTDATANGWYKYSTVNTRSNWSSGNYLFRIDLENLGKAATAWYDNAMLIDLTADFGSGNEPDVEWCDENIEFFIGTKTLSPHLPLYIKQSSQWKPIDKTYIKSNGNWVELNDTELPNHINNNIKYQTNYIWSKSIVDKNIKCLLHGDSLNDSSFYSIPIANTGVTINSTQQHFNNDSLYFNGSAYLTINDTTLCNGTNDWTIDWWEYRTSDVTNAGTITRDGPSGSYNGLLLGYTIKSSNLLQFYAANSATSADWNMISGCNMGSIILNQWVHRCVVRNGSDFYCFENGILKGTATSSESFNATAPIKIGYYAGENYYGYLSEICFRDNAKWISDFTPPIEPYIGFKSIEYVSDKNVNAYPIDGFADDGYYYRLI